MDNSRLYMVVLGTWATLMVLKPDFETVLKGSYFFIPHCTFNLLVLNFLYPKANPIRYFVLLLLTNHFWGVFDVVKAFQISNQFYSDFAQISGLFVLYLFISKTTLLNLLKNDYFRHVLFGL